MEKNLERWAIRMLNNNDEKILKLKEIVEAKREELSKIPQKFVPETNCMLSLYGHEFNLHTITDYNSLILPIKSLMLAAESLDQDPATTLISGFPLSAWFSDIMTLQLMATAKSKRKELDRLEKQLDSLLSSEKSTELKVNNLEDWLLKI